MHYIKQLVHDGTIHLLFCASSKQIADIFTKVFCEKTFNNLKSLLGLLIMLWSMIYDNIFNFCFTVHV